MKIIPPPSPKINPLTQTKNEAAPAALGNVRKIAANRSDLESNQQTRDDGLQKKFALTRLSSKILRDCNLNCGTCFCGQALLPKTVNRDQVVRIMYDAVGGTASYGGLQQCGSPWLCAVCATKLAERKKERLSLALSAWSGGKALITYTIPHDKSQPLSLVLERLLDQRRKLRQSHDYRTWKRGWGVKHYISCLEVTWSPLNGWHPHLHEVCLFEQQHGPSACGCELRLIWSKLCKEHGLAPNQHCLEFQEATSQSDYIASYLEKFGHQPLEETKRKKWTVEKEVSGSTAKSNRSLKCPHYNQWELLQLASQGKVWAKHLWIEFAISFKGRHQLEPSRNFWRELTPGISEVSDQELVKQEGKNAVCIGQIDSIVWKAVRLCNGQCQVLAAARSGRWSDVEYVLGQMIDSYKLSRAISSFRYDWWT